MRAVQTVVVDLCDLSFLDSTGLAAVLLGSKAAREAGRRLVVVADQDWLCQRIERMHLSAVVTVVGTRDEALAT